MELIDNLSTSRQARASDFTGFWLAVRALRVGFLCWVSCVTTSFYTPHIFQVVVLPSYALNSAKWVWYRPYRQFRYVAIVCARRACCKASEVRRPRCRDGRGGMNTETSAKYSQANESAWAPNGMSEMKTANSERTLYWRIETKYFCSHMQSMYSIEQLIIITTAHLASTAYSLRSPVVICL